MEINVEGNIGRKAKGEKKKWIERRHKNRWCE